LKKIKIKKPSNSRCNVMRIEMVLEDVGARKNGAKAQAA
jgi:hypothetical protein